MNFLIYNVRVLTMNAAFDEWTDGCVVVEGDSIVAVGEKSLSDRYPSHQRIDGDGGILIPGLVNAHTHVGMIPFRSLGDDCPDRLRRLLFPLEAAMTRELVRASARYACCEMLLAGTTTIVDMYFFEGEIAKVVKEAGMRALLGETVIDFPVCDAPAPYGGLDYAARFIPEWLGDELITPMIAPHGTNTNSPEKIMEAWELARRHGVPMTMHVSEMDYEVAHFRGKYALTPIGFLDSLGVLDEYFIAAHCILAEETDLDILARRGCAVAHCIGANTKSAKGVAPVKAMLERGIPVALGTDGPASGNTLDLFTQMDLFAKFHKTANRDRAIFPAREIVALATIGAAKALRLDDKTGSIEIGKKADLTLVETRSANMFPIYDPYATVVYGAKAANVDSVFVNGRPLVRGKRLTCLSLEAARDDLSAVMGDFRLAADRLSAGL
ncbi:MAG: amidohydrolase [Treponema sp. GWB1_62_6]|nr:MAG: amidohydrolase [Treponema sp. GWB1_62_6]